MNEPVGGRAANAPHRRPRGQSRWGKRSSGHAMFHGQLAWRRAMPGSRILLATWSVFGPIAPSCVSASPTRFGATSSASWIAFSLVAATCLSPRAGKARFWWKPHVHVWWGHGKPRVYDSVRGRYAKTNVAVPATWLLARLDKAPNIALQVRKTASRAKRATEAEVACSHVSGLLMQPGWVVACIESRS